MVKPSHVELWIAPCFPSGRFSNQQCEKTYQVLPLWKKSWYIRPSNYIWLVVEPYPSEKWWGSSVGMMTLPIWWESHKSHVPNRQPAMVYDTYNYNGGFEPTSNWGAPLCIVLLWFIVAIDYDLRCFTMMYCDLLWLGRIVIYYELIWI